MKALDTSYASVELQTPRLKIVWKSRVQTLQFKLVLDLVTRLVEKHLVEVIAEDQSRLILNDIKGTNLWLSKYYIPTVAPNVKSYFLLPSPRVDSVLSETKKLRVIPVKNLEDLDA